MPFLEENTPKIKGHLDIELAFNDQKKLEMENYHRMKIGKMKILNYQNRSQIDKGRIKLLECQMGKVISTNGDSDVIANQADSDLSDCSRSVCDDSKNLPLSGEQKSKDHQNMNSNANECDLHDQAAGGVDKVIINHPCDQLESPESSVVNSVCGQGPPENGDKGKGNALDEQSSELVFTVTAQEQAYRSAKEAFVIENTNYQITGLPKMYAEYANSPYLTKHLGLNVMIETLPKFQHNHSMYSIPCQTYLRRDQYCSHFKNVHDDIHGGLNTWLQQRCPLAQYGCPFIRYRFRPGSKEGCLVYDQEIGGFAVKPGVPNIHQKVSKENSLLCMPFEVIENIVEFLDSCSIIQFSKTCKITRDACRSLVQRKGIVLIDWKRGTFSDGSVSWKPCKMVSGTI